METLPSDTNALHVSCQGVHVTSADPGLILNDFSNITSLWLSQVPWQSSLFTALCDILGLESLRISHCPAVTMDTSLISCFRTLTHLDLSNNSLETLLDGSFSHLQDLLALNLSHNSLRHLAPSVFSTHLQSLQVLDLSHNLLTSVDSYWFDHLTALAHLNVSANQVESMWSRDLWVANLHDLDLSRNVLCNLSGFSNLTHLQRLDLSDNQIEEVEGSQLQGLISLRELDLQANQISSVQFSGPNSLPVSLKNLQLSHNKIRSLSLVTLDELSTIVHINLSHNCISEIASNPWMAASHATPHLASPVSKGNQSQPSLGTSVACLDLSNNQLRSLNRQVLQHPGLTALRHLNVSHNQIAQLPRYGIETMEYLETADFSHNNITWLDVGTFKNPNLRFVDLSYNYLVKVISMSFLYVPLIEHIDLSHNRINYLYRYVFYKTCGTVDAININVNLDYNQLESDVLWKMLSTFRPLEDTFCTATVSVRNNRLTHLLGEALESYQKHIDLYDYGFFRVWEKVIFDARDNPFICDCVMHDEANALLNIRQTFDYNSTLLQNVNFWEDLSCQTPKRLNNETIQTSLPKISCSITDYCPHKCSCTYRPATQITSVNCSDRGLTDFPAVLPMGLKQIFLQRNRLRILSENMTSLYDVTHVDLSENFISYIDYDAWLKLIEVPTVLLHHNKLRTVPKNVMLGKRITIKNITLAGNDFRCICENLWLKHWLANHTNIVHGATQILCTNSLLFGRVLILLNDSAFNCPKLPNFVNDPRGQGHVGVSLSAIIAMVTAPVIIIALVVVVYVARWRGGGRVHALHNWRPHQVDDVGDVMYDVYVSYCTTDVSWVRNELQRRLLGHDPPYRLYLQHDSRGPASLLTDLLLDGMDRCETIIFVVSSDLFQTDDSRQAWQRVVRHSPLRLIVVLLNSDLDLDLRDATCLRAHEPLFWEKLFHLLPNPLPKKPSSSLYFDLASQHQKY